MSEMIERVAGAIREAEIGYSIRLTRLVDEVATYTLTRPGHEPLDFSSHDEALEYVRDLRDTERARAAIEAMREPTEGMIDAGYASLLKMDPKAPDACSVTCAHRAMIDAALSIRDEKDGRPPAAPGRAGGPDGPEPQSVSSPSGRSSLTQDTTGDEA